MVASTSATSRFHWLSSGVGSTVLFGGATLYAGALITALVLGVIAMRSDYVEHDHTCFAVDVEVTANHGCTTVFSLNDAAVRRAGGAGVSANAAPSCYHVNYNLAPRDALYGDADRAVQRRKPDDRFYIETGTRDAADQLAAALHRVPFACTERGKGNYQTQSAHRTAGSTGAIALSIALCELSALLTIVVVAGLWWQARYLADAYDCIAADLSNSWRLLFRRPGRDGNKFLRLMCDLLESNSSSISIASMPPVYGGSSDADNTSDAACTHCGATPPKSD